MPFILCASMQQIECHNHHMEVFHDVACSEERSGLWCYLPNGKIPRINPKEVTCNTAIGLTKEFRYIHSDLSSYNGVSYH